MITEIQCCCCEDRGRGHELRNVGSLQEVGKGKSVKEKVTILRDGYDLSGLAIWLLIILALVEGFFANKPIEKKVNNAL